MVDEPEPLELEPAVVLDQVEAVAFEPTETEFEDLQLAHAGAWAIPADLADEAADPELVDEDFTADASPAPEEPEWSVEAEPEPSLDIAPDEEPDEEPELVIEVEALPDLPEDEPPAEPALELEPEEERPAVVAEQSAVEPEPEAVDFDAERYTSIIDQPDWFAAEADDWSTGTTSSEATGESEETEGPTAIEPPFQEPDAPEADAPEAEATQPEHARERRRRDGGGRRRAGRVRRTGIAVGARAPGLARARRGAGGLRRPRHRSRRPRASSTTNGHRRRPAARARRHRPRARAGMSRRLRTAPRCRAARARGRIGGFVGSSRPEAGGSSPAVRPVDCARHRRSAERLRRPGRLAGRIGSRSGDPRRERRGGRGRRGGRPPSP